MIDIIFEWGALNKIGFTKHQENIIDLVIHQFEEMSTAKHIDDFLIYKAKIILHTKISNDTFGMVQPLIDENHIIGHRIYINSNYNYTDKELKQVLMHELIHTLSEKNILKHESLKFNELCKMCNRLYGYDPKMVFKQVKE